MAAYEGCDVAHASDTANGCVDVSISSSVDGCDIGCASGLSSVAGCDIACAINTVNADVDASLSASVDACNIACSIDAVKAGVGESIPLNDAGLEEGVANFESRNTSDVANGGTGWLEEGESSEGNISGIVKNCRGKLIAITGDFNKGKTWLVDKLTHVPKSEDDMGQSALPDGFQLSTPGLCAKRVEINGAHLVFVDTAGKNQSIPMTDAAQFDAAFKEEHFQRNVLSELCPNVLFVIGKMSRTEQKTMREICEALKRSKIQKKHNPKLFVVHNWKEITDQPLFDSAIEEVCSLLGVSDNVAGDVARVSRSPGTTFCLFETERDQSAKEATCDAAQVAKLKHDYVSCLKRKDAQEAVSIMLKLQECNIVIRHGVVTKSVGQFVHLQWDSGTVETCDHGQFLELCRDERIAQTCPERATYVRENRMVRIGDFQHAIPIITGVFDEIDVRHFFLANDCPSCDFGHSYNIGAFPVIRGSLQEAACFTTTPGLALGFFNYMAEFKAALERVSVRFFKVDQGTKPDFCLKMNPEASQVCPTNHIGSIFGFAPQKIEDCDRQKLLEDRPELFYDVVIRPYPNKDFRYLPTSGLELRLNREFMADQSKCNVFRMRLTPFSHFLPDLNKGQELLPNPSSALSHSDLGSVRFISINGHPRQYRILTTSEIPECKNPSNVQLKGDEIQRKRYIIDVPGCVGLGQSINFDGQNLKVSNDGKKANDVHFKYGGGGTFEIRSKNLKQHEFVDSSKKWTDVTVDEGEEVLTTEKGNTFKIGFGIDSSKTKIVQDHGVLIIEVTSQHDDDGSSTDGDN